MVISIAVIWVINRFSLSWNVCFYQVVIVVNFTKKFYNLFMNFEIGMKIYTKKHIMMFFNTSNLTIVYKNCAG